MNIENEFGKWVEDYGLEYEPDYSEMHRFDCHAAFVAGVEAARTQCDQDAAVGWVPVILGEPDYACFTTSKRRLEFWRTHCSEWEVLPLYTQPRVDGRVRCDEPFGTESAYQEARDRPLGSNMNISCALVAELVEKFRLMAKAGLEK